MPVGGLAGAQPVRIKGAETAVALRPVDAGIKPQDARLDGRRDLPVGPAPAFKVNILQDLRDSLREPPEAGPAATPAEAPAPEDTAEHRALYRSEPPPESRDHALNIKV